MQLTDLRLKIRWKIMKYELTFLLNDGEDLKSVKDLILSFKGKIEKEEDWGKKSLAYNIKNSSTANFYHYVISIEKDKINEMKKKLNFNEKLLRYLLLISEN